MQVQRKNAQRQGLSLYHVTENLRTQKSVVGGGGGWGQGKWALAVVYYDVVNFGLR